MLAGAALALGHAPFDFPWTLFLAVPALVFLVNWQTRIRAYALGWLAGCGYFLVALNWIVEPFLVDMAATGWMAPFALLLMAGGLALFWLAAFGLAGMLRASRLRLVALPALWSLAEMTRSVVLSGFPWALPGYVWMETPLAQTLAFIGPYGLTYLTLQLAALPALLPHRALVAAPLAAGILAAGWFGGLARIPDGFDLAPTTVRLIQPNAAQHEKWDPAKIPEFWQRQLAFTAAPGNVDVVIWPEVAVPYLFDERADLNAAIAAAKPEAMVMFGARRVDRELDRWFNSAVLLNNSGGIQAYYDKTHLVPFGEYLPLPDLWERFGLRALAQHAGRFDSGAGGIVGAVDGIPPFLPLICYEIIFPDEVRRGATDTRWIAHLTNDAWFGAFAGPFQHLAQTRARAIETGRPVVRAANTGISAVIDPFGRIVAMLPLGQDGFVDARLPEPIAAVLPGLSHILRGLALVLAGTCLAILFGRPRNT